VPELWPGVLGRLAGVVGGWGAGLLAFDPAQHMTFTATPNYADVFVSFAAASDRYDNRRPSRALKTGHVGFMHDLEIFTQDELDADPVYRDFIYTHGVKWTAGTVIPVPTSDLMAFDISRREADGPFTREMMLRLDRLRPHLARAALLSHRLGLRAARSATEAMEIMGLPAAMLAADGRVVSANASLEALSPRIRFLAFDRLMLGTPAADRLLTEAIDGLSTGAAAGVRSIPLPATEEQPALVAHLLPVRRTAADIFAMSAGLLVVTRVTLPEAPLADVLTGLFDLTAAEVRVARGVARGQSIAELAAANAISRETVRTQLKSIMAKTGTSRQIDLALLLSGTRPI